MFIVVDSNIKGENLIKLNILELIEKMEEIKVKIPETLREDRRKIEREVAELISSEEKIKLLSVFLDNAMKGLIK